MKKLALAKGTVKEKEIGSDSVNNKMVEMTLKQILDIDKRAVEMQEKIEETSQAREKELKKLFRKMEFDVMRSARKEAKAKYKAILEEAAKVEKNMNEEKKVKIDQLQNLVDRHSDKLVEELFAEIFG